MIFLQLLLFFILGIAFAEWIIPFLDGILSLFLAFIEAKKARHAMVIAKIQSGLDITEKSPAIGFEWVGTEEGEEES